MGEELKARGTARLRIDADADDVKTVTARAGTASAYYGNESVSASNNEGTLAAGSALTLTQTKFFLTQGTHTRLMVGSQDNSLTGVEGRVDDLEASRSRSPINVKDAPYNAVGDGVVDDTAAIQAAINACLDLPLSDASVTTRQGTRALYLPGGRYRITAPLVIRSVLGFKMYGDGAYTQLMIHGTGISTVLDLDGVAYSTFRDFRIQQYSEATTNVTNGLHLHKTAAAARSTRNVTFENIHILELKFVNGFALEVTDGTKECTWITLSNCACRGSWLAGETTWWQAAFKAGSGVGSNAMGHYIYNFQGEGVRRGVWENASGGGVFGASFGLVEAAFYGTIFPYFMASDIRVEVAPMVWDFSGNAGFAQSVTLKNVEWAPGDVAYEPADDVVIRHHKGGRFSIEDLSFHGTSATCTPKIEIACDVSAKGVMNFKGVTASTAPESFIVNLSPGKVLYTLEDYGQTNAIGDTITGAYQGRVTGSMPQVASAAEVTLPFNEPIVEITGTTSITSIVITPAWAGKLVTLKFAGTLTVTDGINLNLAGNMVTTASDTITLVADGASWNEIARSVN